MLVLLGTKTKLHPFFSTTKGKKFQKEYLPVLPHPLPQLLQKLRVLIAVPHVPRDLGNVRQPPPPITSQSTPGQKRVGIPLQIKQMQPENPPEQPTQIRPQNTFSPLDSLHFRSFD